MLIYYIQKIVKMQLVFKGLFSATKIIILINTLSNLINLRELDLSENNISEISALIELTNLSILYLYSNNIIDISPFIK